MSEKLTTAGSISLKHSMPTLATKNDFDIYKRLDKKGVADVVASLLKNGGPTATEHINQLGKLFFNTATEIGASTPLSDYVNNSDERQAIISEYEIKVQRVLYSNKTKAEKNSALMDLTGAYNKKIESQNLQYLLARNSTAAKMADTGARGNPAQLATGTSTPLMSLNVKGELIPLVIKRSFAEGMKPAEHIALSYMGRSSTVLAQLSTSLPGALFKKLSPTVFHEVVTIPDCGTKNGITVPITDKKSLLGRYTADTNTLILEPYLGEMVNSGKVALKVRSAMTCEAKDGVCQKCFGLMAHGRLPEIGTNVGVIAAQSVSEVLTQSMLSTKHKANVGERKGNAYELAANILNNPTENFKDEATISGLNGIVSDIRKTPLGDSHVFINEKMHFVPIAQNVLVAKGDTVKIGQKISTGTINPRRLVALRGLGSGRSFMADELRDIYSGGLDPRHFEIIAKNMLKYVKVDHPGSTGLLPGDKVEINTIRKYLDKGATTVPLDKAEGSVLAKGISDLVPGTLLDFNHIEDLRKVGVTAVPISNTGLRVTPIVPGLQTAKLLDKNWISKLSFSRLRDSLQESAAVGSESEVHSTDPITSYTMGSEFGEGKEGKY
jgi:DNA-directed RNA polymerase subunit beta'